MEEREIGKIIHYFSRINVGIVELSDALRVGDKVRIRGHAADFTEDISSMQIEHAIVTEAKAGDKVGIKVPQKVHENDKVYKIV